MSVEDSEAKAAMRGRFYEAVGRGAEGEKECSSVKTQEELRQPGPSEAIFVARNSVPKSAILLT
jgi:hypothetical protein